MKKTRIAKMKNFRGCNFKKIGFFSTLCVRNTTRAIITIVSFITISMVPLNTNAADIYAGPYFLGGPYTTGSISDGGGYFLRTSQYLNRYIGKGYAIVNVELTGWSFDFKSDDHHIDQIGIYIHNILYNKNTGVVSFSVSGRYNDKNNDDAYNCEVFYKILALK